MTSIFKQGDIKVGDLILETEDFDAVNGDPNDDMALWGDVLSISSLGVNAAYDLGDPEPVEFVVTYEDIRAVKRNGKLLTSGEQPASNPMPNLPIQPKSNVTNATAAMQTVTPVDVAKIVPVPKVAPGTIIKTNRVIVRGMPIDRLWVVLAWTKNSAQSKVNIYPVNGPQPGEKYNYKYHTVQVSVCKPVRFGTLSQVRPQQ